MKELTHHGLDKEGIAAARHSSRLKSRGSTRRLTFFLSDAAAGADTRDKQKERTPEQCRCSRDLAHDDASARYTDMETEKINTAAVMREHLEGRNHSHTSHFFLLQQRQFGHKQTFAYFIKPFDHPDTFAMDQRAMSQEGMNIAILLMLVMLVFYNSCLGFYVWRAERIRSRASHEHASSHTSPEP